MATKKKTKPKPMTIKACDAEMAKIKKSKASFRKDGKLTAVALKKIRSLAAKKGARRRAK